MEYSDSHPAFRKRANANELELPRKWTGELFIDQLVYRKSEGMFHKRESDGEIWWDIEIEPLIQKHAIYKTMVSTISKVPHDAIEKAAAILKHKKEYEIET